MQDHMVTFSCHVCIVPFKEYCLSYTILQLGLVCCSPMNMLMFCFWGWEYHGCDATYPTHYITLGDIQYLCLITGDIKLAHLAKFDKFLWTLPIFNWVVGILLMSFKSSFYLLDTRPLSAVWIVSVSSHSVGCVFTLLLVSFAAWKF